MFDIFNCIKVVLRDAAPNPRRRTDAGPAVFFGISSARGRIQLNGIGNPGFSSYKVFDFCREADDEKRALSSGENPMKMSTANFQRP